MGTRAVETAEEALKAAQERRARRDSGEDPWAGHQAKVEELSNDPVRGNRESPENVKAIANGQRVMRRMMRREAKRMTLAKYSAQLERTAQRKQATHVRAISRQALTATASVERGPERTRPREHRAATRARARSPGGDPEPEPELPAGLTFREVVRRLVSEARRALVTDPDLWDWRKCKRCQEEWERSFFSTGSSYCKRCESERVTEYKRRRKAMAT